MRRLWVPPAVIGQSCDLYFPLVKNAEYEIVIYSARQKKKGRILYVVKEVSQKGNTMEAQMLSQLYDHKDKLSTENNYNLLCEDNQTMIDMRAYINPETMDAYQDMDIKMEGDHLMVPSLLQIGQSLPEGTMTMLVSDKESGNVISRI